MGVGIDLYFWSLKETADPRCLSPDETMRMNRFVYPEHQHAFLAARSGLRHVLGRITDTAPDELVFSYGPQGKPALAQGPSFNLSHSKKLACLAVHPTTVLGADIEGFREIEEGVAERFFSAAEYAALQELSGGAKEAGFFRCWTRKEAVVKALGGGLSIPLDAFDVTLDASGAQLTRLESAYGNASDWALAPFQVGSQMMGCVAAQTDGTPITLQVRSAPNGLEFAA